MDHPNDREPRMDDFVARPRASSWLLTRMRRQRREHLVEHVRQFARGLGLDLEPIAARLSTIDVGRKWRPELSWWCYRLQLALERRDVTLGADALARLRALPVESACTEGVVVRGLFVEEWETEWAALTRDNAARRGLRMAIRPLPDDRMAHYREALHAALARLRRADPETFAEFEEHCSDVCVFGGNFNSSQNVATAFGMMAFGFGPDEPDMSGFLLGQLAHEAGHMRLCALMENALLLVDDGRPRHRLSARPDLRPMTAVLHAAFVYARTIRVLERALALEPDDASLHRKLVATIPAFRRAYGLVRKDAELTEYGRHLVESMPQTIESPWED